MAGRTAAGGGNWAVSATPAVAGLATLCAATALSSVIGGALWLVNLAVAIIVVAGVGVLLRAARLPIPLVGLGQVFALLCLLVTIFTRTGVLLVFPGPQSLSDLLTVLGTAFAEVQTGVPPVDDSEAMRCLVMLAIGLVAVLVDLLAVGASAPAASGLVLLCVFAVPASLADEMLPLWTFVFGAAAFALLLAVDGQHRHEAWRGRLPNGGVGGAGPAATGVAGLAVVVALLAGASLTLVGTVGRLPGTGDSVGGGADKLGLDPMTELRGMLNQGATRELFRVRDLPESSYLRAMTLREYVPDEGWRIGEDLPPGVAANGDLPAQPGDPGGGETVEVTIEPVSWLDNWLPVYGRPRRIQDVDQNWRYDPVRGMVYSVHARQAGTYKIQTVLKEPGADALRKASGTLDIEDAYLEAPGVSPEVANLARTITRDQDNTFDKAAALHRFFTDGTQGFTYTTQTTGPQTSDALRDFVFTGKKGYCEQYASAMAIMARSVGLPSRVAMGFTAGFPTDDYQTITTQDAHAWVEIYFPGYGWMVFDPTPLSDGRGLVPPYIAGQNPDGEETDTTDTTTTTTIPTTAGSSGSTSAAPGATGQDGQTQDEEPTPTWHTVTLLVAAGVGVLLTGFLLVWRNRRSRGPGPPDWAGRTPWLLPALGGTAVAAWMVGLTMAVALLSWWVAGPLLAVLVAAVPAGVRAVRRKARLQAVASLGPDAAGAAWQELLAESVDRGTRVPTTETVRVAARRLVRAHNLDEQGRDGLRAVVGAVERSWYSARADADPSLPQAFDEVRRSLSRNAPLALRAKVLPRSVLHPNVPPETT
ncbi:transglutaminaseTgpA domain-containing protein [Actinosynnema sp. CS-041913]|uniref:transglutaminase family protein n=1 Tax=Actinosynnema sp. CS-041913 TaxID=3239917 RepID=UPI003D8CB79E